MSVSESSIGMGIARVGQSCRRFAANNCSSGEGRRASAGNARTHQGRSRSKRDHLHSRGRKPWGRYPISRSDITWAMRRSQILQKPDATRCRHAPAAASSKVPARQKCLKMPRRRAPSPTHRTEIYMRGGPVLCGNQQLGTGTSMQRCQTVHLQDFNDAVKDQAHSHSRDEEADNPGSRIDS